MDKKALCLYLPVVHQGYLNLFDRLKDYVETLYIFGPDVLDKFKYRGHEIRALDPVVALKIIKSLDLFSNVEILTMEKLGLIRQRQIILTRDSISLCLAEEYFVNYNIEWDTAFLRWDSSNVFSQEPLENIAVSTDDRDREMMSLAIEGSNKSSDWWRQVGAVAVKDGKKSVSWNLHLPSEYEPYFDGDPRDAIEPGKHSELCSAIHSEQAIISRAASMVLRGADMYVSTFPCPVCAKLLALAGIKRLFFKTGHSSLDGRKVLEAFNVEIIKVI